MSARDGQKKARGKLVHPVLTTDSASGKTIIRPRKELLVRQNKTASRVAALNELHEELAVATEVFLNLGDGGREGVYDATCALMDYLTGQGIPHAALEPLIAVQTAIVDADRGTISPIFAPVRKPKSGKPPMPDMQRAFEGRMAVVMECCVEHCRNAGKWPFVRPAAQLAEKLINESDWPVRVTARQLEKLRQRIQQSPAGSVDRAQVDASFRSGVAKSRPLEWAKALLSNASVNPPAKLSE